MSSSSSREPATLSQAQALPPQSSAGSRRFTWLVLALLTLLSAGLHFYHLERPAFWRDEAYVYWRVCGSYGEMLQLLRNDGFVPLHYELYWLLGKTLGLTPCVMRSIPALAGALMTPAVYFLACQLVRRRTALLAAAFTAFSAYVAYYSRDAKMYMHFWLFCTLNVACLLWWSGRGDGGGGGGGGGGGRLAWWSWVATGAAMVGLHAAGFLLLPLQLLMRVTRRGASWKSHLLFLLGLVLISAGPAGYYLGFNHWRQNITQRGWHTSGLDWIAGVDRFMGERMLVESTTRDFLLGWGLPQRGVYAGPDATVLQVMGSAWPILCLTLAAGLFPWPSLLRRKFEDEPPPQPWWRSFLWLTAWMLLPLYAFYCASVDEPLSPWALLRQLEPEEALGYWIGGAAVVALGAYWLSARTHGQRLIKTLQLLAVTGAILLLAWAIQRALEMRPPGPVWVTRYLGFAWPAFAISLAVLLRRLPLLPLRWTAIAAVLAFNLLYGLAPALVYLRGPVDVLARDVLDAQGETATTQTFLLNFYAPWSLDSAEGRYYLAVWGGKPMHPEQFIQRNADYQLSFPRSPVRVMRLGSRASIVRLIATRPRTQRLVVWDGPRDSGSRGPEEADDLLPLLPATGWRQQSVTRFRVYDNNGWEGGGQYRRREYVRDATPATASSPSPAPATAPGR